MSTHNTIQLDEKLTKETVDSKDGKPAKSATQIDDKLHWYKDAIIYELHIKAFRDGNKDGIGDFEGLMEKLDYLQSLGVTAIWLLPFYPSPLRDDGYDIADYYTINPAYGNIDQFKNFLDEAHSRNLKVITELVVNHTSDQHPWFQRARKAPKNSPYRNYYVWTDDRDQYKDVRIIFQDFEASNWTWDNEAQQYYWHRFFHHQPDLNFDNPAVQQEIFNVLEYWCELGVDGFRLDAVPYLFERDGTNCENLNETHSFLKKLRAHVDKHYPGTLLLAEANMWPEDSASYFGKGDECHMNYHFPLMPRMFMAVQMEDRYPIIDILDQTPEIPEVCQWAIFLRNHDELTLEMVTDEERDYMYRVYVKDPRARINLGIRHRLAPLMENDRKKIELMNYLLFSLPGTPVLYYGDEIGMGDNYYLGDRDGVRTPMQWSSDRNAGFSEANPQKLYLPVIQDPLYQYEWVNVEIQSANSSSLLWWMRRLIQVRKKYKAFSRGDIKFINVENPKIFAFTRNYEDETILVVVNLSRFPQPAELDLSAYKGYQVMEIFSKAAFPSVKNDPYFFTLGQYEAQWYVLQPVQAVEEKNISIHLHGATEMKELMKDKNREKIESIVLPQYMMKRRWFGGKAREMSGIKIVDHAELTLPEHHSLLLLVEVSYMSGLPDTYLLPVTVASGAIADNIRELSPAAVICDVIVEKQSCLLYDALYCTDLQQYILWQMANNNTISTGKNKLEFTGTKALERYLKEKEGTVKSRVLAADQSNTSIIFDSAFFLKIYRKVDRAMNPDVEISQFLTGAKFNHIPSYVGSVTWTNASGSMALGMMQEMVDNTLDGWTYMLDKLKNYYERIQVSGPGTEDLRWPEESGISDTVDYEHAPEELKKLIEANVADKVHLLGVRTAEMHLALASSHDNKDFDAEPFSLHYQRSLFSAFLSLVRKTFQNLEKSLGKLSPEIKAEAEEVLRMKDKIMLRFRHIYHKKMDALKIRVHGDYHLGQILFTGNDLVILDFEGEPAHSFSERRLKKSPLRDVAGMMRSLHYAAYGELLLNSHQAESDINKLTPFADIWYHYMSGFYLESYLEIIKDSNLIPGEIADLEIMLGTYTLEKAIYELNYELNNRPDWVIIPIRGIKAIMQKPSVIKYDS